MYLASLYSISYLFDFGVGPGVHVNLSQSVYTTKETSGQLQGMLVSSRPLPKTYSIKLTCASGSALSKNTCDVN